MMDIILASLGIFIGEFYGNFVGGGSLVTQFFLQNIIGFPLKEAIALDNAAVLGSELGLLFVLLPKEKLSKNIWVFTFFVLIGSFFGAQGLKLIPVEILSYIFVGVLLIVVLKILFYKEKKQKTQDLKDLNKFTINAFAFAIGAYNAFLSVGDWIFGLLGLVLIFHLPYRKSIFLLAFSLFLGRLFATGQYFSFGYIDVNFWVPMFLSALTSGVLAGTLLDKVKIEFIKPALKVLGVILAAYLTVSLF
jgi:uncharacterized membrane protein YfcA